jgi:hypothetical protein
MYRPGADSRRVREEWCVIRRLVLIVLALMLIVAAGLVTAIFIFRHPKPIEFQQATASHPVRFPRAEAARSEARTEIGVDAVAEATFPEQEMAVLLGPIYWKGAVTVSGTVTGVARSR